MSYDQSSYDLAESFLEDEPELNTEENRKELAQDIQRAIEDFISGKNYQRLTIPLIIEHEKVTR